MLIRRHIWLRNGVFLLHESDTHGWERVHKLESIPDEGDAIIHDQKKVFSSLASVESLHGQCLLHKASVAYLGPADQAKPPLWLPKPIAASSNLCPKLSLALEVRVDRPRGPLAQLRWGLRNEGHIVCHW